MRDAAAIAAAIIAGLAVGAVPVTVAAGADPAHAHEVLSAGTQLPGESVYQLPVQLTKQDGTGGTLESLRGRPVLVTMFYTSCDGVCPMLAFAMRRVVAAVPAKERSGLQMLMVSFDPKRDSPQALQAFAELHQLAAPQWLLARAPESDVRGLAAVLGIRYRELPGAVFSHSAVITLLDAEGVIRARTTTLTELDADFMRAVNATLQ